MAQIRTLLTRVRASRDGIIRLAQLVQTESIQNRSTLVPLQDACIALLHATLPRLSTDDDAGVVRSAIETKAPHLLEVIDAYQEGKRQKGVFISNLDLGNLERKKMRSFVSLSHNMHQIEDVLNALHKSVLPAPTSLFEEDPLPWVEYLNVLKDRIRNNNITEEILRETRKVEMRTHEGFPTIMLHALRSLELYQRCIDEYKEAYKLVDNKNKRPISVDKKSILVESVKYVHDAEVLLEAIRVIIDVSALGPSTAAWRAADIKQTVFDFLLGTLRIWNTRLDQHEMLLNKYIKSNPDIPDESLTRAIMVVRHGARATQDWLLSDKDHTTSNPEQLLSIVEKSDAELDSALAEHRPILLGQPLK